MKTTKIETIWSALEADNSFSQSILLRRYGTEIKPDVYVAIKNAEKLRCVAFRVSKDFDIKSLQSDRLREIRVEISQEADNPSKKLLFFVLLTPVHTDIFAVLCEDLIQAVATIENEPLLLKVLKQRFIKWQNLFEKLQGAGLSIAEQKGLYGELYVLRELLKNLTNSIYLLNCWLGMSASPQDFFYQNFWALEVKTTEANRESINISNEFQLDETAFHTLMLIHLSLVTNTNRQGESLIMLVNSIIDLLKNDAVATLLFKQKLLDVGYYDLHHRQYENSYYNVLATEAYVVKDNFPRITPQNIKIGITQVTYQIQRTHLHPYQIPFSKLFELLKQYE
jgi:hypothetical protein